MGVPWFPLTSYKTVKSKLPREGVHMYFRLSAHLFPCHLTLMFNMKLPFLSWAPTTRKLPHCNDGESLYLSEILLVFTGVWREDEKNFTLDCWLLPRPRSSAVALESYSPLPKFSGTVRVWTHEQGGDPSLVSTCKKFAFLLLESQPIIKIKSRLKLLSKVPKKV